MAQGGIMADASWIKANYPGYSSWNDDAAVLADYAATGGAGKGGSSSGGGNDVDSILKNAIDPIVSMLQASRNYEKDNPFFFDEALAREASKAEYSPYYDELLSDYVSDTERTKSRSKEDLDKILEQLSASKEYYVGRERRLLDKSLRNTNEGYAGNNLFFSGARERDVKELQGEYMAGIGTEQQPGYYLQNYQRNVGEAKTNAQRTASDAELAQKRYTRDTERDKQYAIEGGVLQRENEVRDEYEGGRSKYYEDWYLGRVGA